MKKFYLLSGVLMSMSLFSCHNSDPVETASVEYPTTNLITYIPTGEVTVSSCSYRLDMDMIKFETSVSTQNFEVGTSKDYFSSPLSHFSSVTYSYLNSAGQERYGQLLTVEKIGGYLNNNTSLPVEGENFMVSSLNYYNNLEPGSASQALYYPAVVAHYTIGDQYDVKTISVDAVYEGKTVTSYPDRQNGGVTAFENDKMQYRVVIDIKNNTAKMIMYSAKFAEPMPALSAIIVDDLKVNWENGSYTITGTDLIPYMYENTNQVPYENYVFNKVVIQPTNDTLTRAHIEFQVAGVYDGSFDGAYLFEPEK